MSLLQCIETVKVMLTKAGRFVVPVELSSHHTFPLWVGVCLGVGDSILGATHLRVVWVKLGASQESAGAAVWSDDG